MKDDLKIQSNFDIEKFFCRLGREEIPKSKQSKARKTSNTDPFDKKSIKESVLGGSSAKKEVRYFEKTGQYRSGRGVFPCSLQTSANTQQTQGAARQIFHRIFMEHRCECPALEI